MDKVLILGLVATVLALAAVVVGTVVFKRKPRKLKVGDFQNRWKELQKLCAKKETWPLAVINADKLLDDALKRLRFRGKTMGERMVAAQRSFTDNDGVWFGHKLRNRLVHEQEVKLKEAEVKDALIGIRQALKDLGALK
jgi:tryptophan 2,3-dioxygenase